MRKLNFVAEISSNHNHDLSRAMKLIEAAADAGCDAVKFQLFKIDELFAPEVMANSEVHRARRKWELPLDFIPPLSARTHELGMEFSCTPFYLEAVKELEPFVDFYKIASYELLWQNLFIACAETGKPLVFSTGMASEAEIIDVLDGLQEYKGLDVTILRCSSAYPTPVHEANLSSIVSMQKACKSQEKFFNISYGWSDHTVSPAVILSAVLKYGSRFIEFHLDLDGKGEEFGPGHCWLPHQIASVIDIIRTAKMAEGSGVIEPGESEVADRLWRADPSDGLRPFISKRKEFK
ncbi:MAG: N-acetylneuraminic acid synthase [Calditrichaeota bacterium]|jgi:sialic acid synthase SpsE|nr:N-acetylneuraminic acid synthase [Calditrichota bacterium]